MRTLGDVGAVHDDGNLVTEDLVRSGPVLPRAPGHRDDEGLVSWLGMLMLMMIDSGLS